MSEHPLAFIDFESRSRAELKTVGGRRYWEDESTEALCAVLHFQDTGESDVWLPGLPPPTLDGYRLVAHNAIGFDRFAAAACWHWRLGKFRRWADTAELARRLGMRGALSALGVKDKEGNKLVRSLSTVRKPKGFPAEEWRKLTRGQKRRRGALPEVTPEILERVVEYCLSDVEAMAHAWGIVAGADEIDADTRDASAAINDRGVAFDADVAAMLLEKSRELARIVLRREAKTLGTSSARLSEIVNSPKQLAEALGSDNAQAETVEAIAEADDPLDPTEAGCYARARMATASIVGGKLAAGLAMVSEDGRLRDMCRYYAAHTGRWGGVGIQLQNMPRPSDAFEGWGDDEFEDLIGALLDRPATRAELELLLRACITAADGHTLIAADWSGIEARALAWFAHDLDALEVFRSNRDVYRVMASVIFGDPYDAIGKGEKRSVGKIAELALGYGQGWRKFGETARKMGSDLDALGVSSRDVVYKWRDLHAPIVGFWRALEYGFREALTAGHVHVGVTGDFQFARDGEDVVLLLPSGRPLYYPSARVNSDGDISYESTKGRAHLYGGKLTENAIQATCRDLLALGLVGAERAGLQPVLHVHDEIVCEVPEGHAAARYEHLTRIMLERPGWASDDQNDRGHFPLAVSGWIGRRYRK